MSVRTAALCLAHVAQEQEGRRFATIKRYWNDPAYRDELDAERVREQAKINADIDASLARVRARKGVSE